LDTRVSSNTSSITAEITRATAAELALTNGVNANAASITSNTNSIAGLDTRVSSNTSSITAEITRATAAELALTNGVNANAASITSNTNSIVGLDTRVNSNTASITLNTSNIALRATIASPSFTGTPTAPTAAAGTSTTQLATTEFVSTMIGGTYTPDADATTKGKLKLTNDLGGTSDLPTVNSVGGVSSTTIATLPTSVAANSASITSLTNSIVSNTSSLTSYTDIIASNTSSITSIVADLALKATINSPSFTGTPTAPTAAPGTSTTQLATTAFVSTMIGGTYTSDANSTTKGKLKLTNDLGGTADLPTVNSVGGVSSATISTLPASVAANTASIISNTNSIASNTASITAEINRATAAELTLTNGVNANTASITSNTSSIVGLDTRVNSNTSSITSEIARAQNAELSLDTKIASNTASITSNTSIIALRATIASPSFTGTPTAPTAAPGTSTTQLATTAFVSTMIGGTYTPDADATNKGKLKLTNDLGGTSDLPTVNSVGGVSSTTIATLPSSVSANTASITSLTNSVVTNTSSITSNTNSIASNTSSITSIVADLALKATINSPSFTGTPTVPAPASNSNSNQIATTAFVNTLVGGASIADANSTTKGKLKLTNDLGGTADLPTVNSVGGVSSTTIATLPTSIASNTSSITSMISDFALKATINSPSFTGTPTVPAPAANSNSNQIATTAFVNTLISGVSGGAGSLTLTGAVTGSGSGSITTTIAPSLALSGVPTAPTNADPTTNNTQIATTAFVQSAISSLPGGANYLNPSSLNVGNTLVKRASDGSFAAGAITATSFIGNVTGTSANITGLLPIMNGGTNATNITDARTNFGLGNIDNTSDVNKPVSTAQLAALNLKANLISPVFTGTPSLPTGTIAVTQGTGDISTAIATTAFVNNSFTTTNIAAGVPSATSSTAGKIVLAGDLGGTFLSPTVVSVGGKSNTSIANAITTVEAATTINTPSTLVMRSATGNISVGSISTTSIVSTTLSGNLTGNVVGNVTGNVSGTALNVTGVVAIANGGTNATNSTDARTNLGLGNIDNTSDVNKPVSTAQLAALNLKANLISPVFTGTPSLPTGTIAVTQGASDASTAIATTA
ncbi:beta strand repeat-containing protein, partial [Aquirufa sp. A-Brett2-15D]